MHSLLPCTGISIENYECVSVAVVIQHVTRVRHTVTCGLSGATILFHIISQPALLKTVITQKMFTDFFIQRLSETFLILRRIQRYTG